MENQINDVNYFRPIKSLIGKRFVVRDYQRGYKWDQKEILELLNDVSEHNLEDGKYCLQPVIVRENENGSLELIDGQQRITSLYLLLVFLNNSASNIFNISYETRTESKEFLSNRIIGLNNFVERDLSWEEFIATKDYKKFDNVDIYHFYTVYKTIYQWFDKRDDSFRELFQRKILDAVHIIWYDIDKAMLQPNEKVTAENVFLNLNGGKILLTSSELIKALFILDCQRKNSKEVYKLKANELALEWDQIENKLQDNSFWFFICDNEKYNNSSTRIDYIFDVVNKRNTSKDDDLFSYRLYEKRFKKNDDLNWLEVKNTFNKLLEWYDDKELYHYVGYLIITKIKNLNKIIDKSIGITKSRFRDELQKWIKKEFGRKLKDEKGIEYHIYDLENLDYRESRKECEKALVLLNLQYYIKNLSDNKFPFELYKNETWSVEHINPQNPREFENVGTIKKWLITTQNYFDEQDKLQESILKQIDTVLVYFQKIETSDKRKLIDLKLDKEKIAKLDELIEAVSLHFNLHGISNLALLDKNSNSKLSNKLFLDKRRLILKLDEEGKYITSNRLEKKVFIPMCTRNVFSKIYTQDSASVTNSFFGKKDMDSYCEFIAGQLSSFLPSN
jgi:uncharacterized protein with ParB-like and HNH nuclease domain